MVYEIQCKECENLREGKCKIYVNNKKEATQKIGLIRIHEVR